MEGEDDVVSVLEVLVHVGDLHAVDMGHGQLHGRGEIDDGFPLRRWLPYVEDGIAYVQRVVDLGAGEALRGVFETVRASGGFGEFFQHRRTFDGNGFDVVLRFMEDLLALGDGGGVVDMDDGILYAVQGFEGAADDVLSRLCQYLDGDVIRDHVFFDQCAEECILCLRGRRKSDFDFLEADGNERLVEFQLLLEAHRDDERLISVTQVHAAPYRSVIDSVFHHPAHVTGGGHEVSFAVFLRVHHNGSSFLLGNGDGRRGKRRKAPSLRPLAPKEKASFVHKRRKMLDFRGTTLIHPAGALCRWEPRRENKKPFVKRRKALPACYHSISLPEEALRMDPIPSL